MQLEQNVNKKVSAAARDRARARFAVTLVSLATGVPADDISCGTRCNARASRARQIAMYLTYIAWRWSMARVGQAFGRDRTTAGYACRLVEEMRDNRRFDATLDRLEACLKSAPEPEGVALLSPNLMEMA